MISVKDFELTHVEELLQFAMQDLKEFRLYSEELERVNEYIREALETVKEWRE